MKWLLLITNVLLTGCNMAVDPEIKTSAEVYDKTGDHRLFLKHIAVGPRDSRGGQGYDFHSLVWESKSGSKWVPIITISGADFQHDAATRRWISKIHSLDPAVGIATIMVGEEAPRDSYGVVHAKYSWREWDIAANIEVRMVRECDSPSEKFLVP